MSAATTYKTMLYHRSQKNNLNEVLIVASVKNKHGPTATNATGVFSPHQIFLHRLLAQNQLDVDNND
jgi:hypothetical protein